MGNFTLRRSIHLAFLQLLSLLLLFTLFETSFAQLADAEQTPTQTKADAKRASTPAKTDAERAPTQTKGDAKRASTPAKPSAKRTSRPLTIESGALITKVTVQGNRKIEADAILAKIQSREGTRFDPEKIKQDVKSIFKLGYFYNIEVSRSRSANGILLTYQVTEKPSIIEIKYVGHDELSEDDLKEAAGIKPFTIVDIGAIQNGIQKMEKLYEDKGFFLAKIKYRFEDVEKNQSVKLIFEIQENDKVKVKSIKFIGNSRLSDDELKSRMLTQEEGFFSFISGSGQFKQEAFERDVSLLQYLYFNKGFVQVKVNRPQITVTPDKKGIYIVTRIEEGEQFDVGDLDFKGDLLFPTDELHELLKIKNSKIFVWETLQEDLRNLQAKYGDLGYAYANIIPRTQVREKDRKVDIIFEIDKGNKVYFGKFNMVGNSKTRDKVIRREMTVFEGELYNETRKRETLDNIKRLGYFDDVSFNTRTPSGEPDIMDVDIAVKERNTGSIQVGAGYSSYANFLFQGQIQQTNLFGKGQKLSASVNLSSKDSLFNFNFTEPYVLDTLWTAGVDLYRSRRTGTQFDQMKVGGAVTVGHPLAPYLRGFIRYKNDYTEISLQQSTDPTLFPVKTANGWTSSITASLEYDKRDDRFSPRNGLFVSTSSEFAGFGGEKYYNLINGNIRLYFPIFWDLVVRNNLNYGYITAPTGFTVPFNELFLLGGPNTLRGYNFMTVGKTINTSFSGTPTDVPYGGTQNAYYQLELEFPLISEAGVKGVFFYDIGYADDVLTLNKFLSDYGFGFRWFSPIGPLRFEWGFPVNPRPGDPATNFQFAIGAPF